MKSTVQREWIPLARNSIKRWVWTKRKGLIVEYKDGLTVPSDWTLPEFLKAIKTGREWATEVQKK